MNNIITGHESQNATDSFFSRLKFGTMLKQCNFSKRIGHVLPGVAETYIFAHFYI